MFSNLLGNRKWISYAHISDTVDVGQGTTTHLLLKTAFTEVRKATHDVGLIIKNALQSIGMVSKMHGFPLHHWEEAVYLI